MDDLFLYLYIFMFFPQFWILNIVFICIYKYIKYKNPNLKVHKFRILIYLLILIISSILTLPIHSLVNTIEEMKYNIPFEKQRHYESFVNKGVDLDNLNKDLIKALNNYEYNYDFSGFEYESVSDVCDKYNIYFNNDMFIFDADDNKHVILSRIEDKNNSNIYLYAKYEFKDKKD